MWNVKLKEQPQLQHLPFQPVSPRSCETPMWRRSVERVLPWVRWFHSSLMLVCQYQVGWTPNQPNQERMFAIFWGVDRWRLEECWNVIWEWYSIVYTCDIYIPHFYASKQQKESAWSGYVGDCVHMICVSESSGRYYGLRRRNWELRLTGFNHVWRKWLLCKESFWTHRFMNASCFFQIDVCIKPGWISIKPRYATLVVKKVKKQQPFQKSQVVLAPPPLPTKNSWTKVSWKPNKKLSRISCLMEMSSVFGLKEEKKLDCDFTTVVGEDLGFYSDWTLDSEWHQVMDKHFNKGDVR